LAKGDYRGIELVRKKSPFSKGGQRKKGGIEIVPLGEGGLIGGL